MNVFFRNSVGRRIFRSTKVSAFSKLYLILAKCKNSGGLLKFFEPILKSAIYLWQQFIPFGYIAEFQYLPLAKKIVYNSKNTQYEVLYNPVFHSGYEPEVCSLLDMLLDQKGTFYDIGSNWGYFSLYAASNSKFSGNIYAFEPFPSTFRDLAQTVKQAGLESRITYQQIALGLKTGVAEMQFQSLLQSGWAALVKRGNHYSKGLLYKKSTVAVTTLDQVALEPPILIKVDVEGSEDEVFKGGSLTLKKSKPYIIFENSFSDNLSQTLDPLVTLTKLGYKLFYPCWLNTLAKSHYFSPVLGNKLALVPITVETRLLYGQQINLFACHASMLPLLKKKFSLLTLQSHSSLR
jgi:FkbM family methyltransferase